MNIAIIGTVGVPANYGGFETLAENLVRFHQREGSAADLTVYCSSQAYAPQARSASFLSARLRYVPLNANGVQSIPYDVLSLLLCALRRTDVILVLGVSGAIALPLIRLISSAKIVTNIDGIEWRREKWRGLAKRFLRWSERLAVKYSHEVVADNAGIADYVREQYGCDCSVIAYGGDHALSASPQPLTEISLPAAYAFSVCRIEPENNIHMILEAFAASDALPLVLVGNWSRSDYGLDLRQRYAGLSHLHLLDPIYDLGKLNTLRANASVYVHGHSAGGTNPSLVEAMHFGRPIFAFDCVFNRATTENSARFFLDAQQLRSLLNSADPDEMSPMGASMREIARRRYTWDVVASEYFALMLG